MNRRRRYSIANESYFSVIDTEEKAYFLGLMGADGYVATNGDLVGLGLSGEDDKPLLDRLQSLLATTYPVKREGPYGISRLPVFKLRVNSSQLRDDLIRHGIVPHKSKTYEFNQTLDSSLLRHYIRGYLDGDGSISILKTGEINVTIVSSIPFARHLAEIVLKEVGAKGNVYIRPSKDYAQFSLVGTFSCFLFLHWLYGHSVVSMDRKRTQYERCKQMIAYKIDNPCSFYSRHKIPKVMFAVERCCNRLGLRYSPARYNGLSIPEADQRQMVQMKVTNQSVQQISQTTGRSMSLVKKVLKLQEQSPCL